MRGDERAQLPGPSRRTLLAAALVGFGVVAGVPVGFTWRLLASADARFPAGTSVDTIDVGGLTPAEAVERFDRLWSSYLRSPVVFTLDDRVWRPTAADLGLSVDYLTPLRDAYGARGAGGIEQRLAAGTPVKGSVASARIDFDPNVLRAYLTQVAASFDQPAAEAAVGLDPTRGALLQVSQPGRVVDIDRALQDVGSLAVPAAPGRAIALQFREDLPSTTTEQAQAVVAELQRMVAGPIALMHGARGWRLRPDELRAALKVDRVGSSLVAGLEFTRFNALFQSIDATLATAPRKTVFEYDEKADRVRAFAPGSSGQIVDRPALERAILDRAKARTDRRVEIPIVVLNKEYDVAANPLGIKDMLATGSSLFRESPRYRVHNIVAGAKALDGQIIRPGASFSFIERIGPVTLRAGFKEGSAIVEDKTERVVGGGICQVSTTLFRAVYLAGMPIEERWPHLYRVHYYEIGGYPIGLDATVFIPGLDLVFRNDLPGPVMIRSRVDVENYALDFELWGVNDGRSVELVDPAVWGWSDPPPDEAVVDSKQDVKYKKQIEWARKGAVAQITRVITKPGLAPVRETLKTGYKPWPNRFQVGIDVAKDKFPIYYNKWVEENPEEAARWGALKVPGVPSDPKAPAG